jgi:hypothetical protein
VRFSTAFVASKEFTTYETLETTPGATLSNLLRAQLADTALTRLLTASRTSTWKGGVEPICGALGGRRLFRPAQFLTRRS